MEAPDPDEDLESVPEDGFIFVLEKATLETAKVGKGYQILNCDDHANFLRRHGKDPADYRPDIIHQELLAVLDSPLNKAGRVKAIFVHTQKNVLFKVSPRTRVPRTFKRFCGLMVQLLQKLSIRRATARRSSSRWSRDRSRGTSPRARGGSASPSAPRRSKT